MSSPMRSPVQTFPLPGAVPGEYTFHVPGRAMQVRLSPELVKTLAAVNVSGLLFGQVLQSGKFVSLEVTHLRPVPGLHPSDPDETALRLALAEGAERTGGSPLGWCVASGNSAVPDGDAVRRMQTCMDHPFAVVVGRDLQPGSGTATLHFFERGREIASGSWPLVPASSLERVRKPIPPPEAPRPARQTRVAVRRIPAAVWLGAAVAAVGMVLWIDPFHRSAPRAATPNPAVASSSRALRVERRGDDLLVTWDSTVLASQGAKQATLSIRDGAYQRILLLDADQLQGGSLVYRPLTSDADFTLEVLRGDASLGKESVRMLNATPVATLVPMTIVPEERDTRSRSRSSAPREPRPAEPATVQPVPEPVKVAVLPPQRRSEPVSMQLPEIPAPKPQPPASGPPLAVSIPVIAPPPVPTPAEPKGAGMPQPAPPTRLSPPKPVHQVRPTLPIPLKQLSAQEVRVDVRVAVDASGSVVSVTPQTVRGPQGDLLARASAAAARQWQFQPATVNGKAVPGEYNITFVFRRPSLGF
jgi:TonB family protein